MTKIGGMIVHFCKNFWEIHRPGWKFYGLTICFAFYLLQLIQWQKLRLRRSQLGDEDKMRIRLITSCVIWGCHMFGSLIIFEHIDQKSKIFPFPVLFFLISDRTLFFIAYRTFKALRNPVFWKFASTKRVSVICFSLYMLQTVLLKRCLLRSVKLENLLLSGTGFKHFNRLVRRVVSNNILGAGFSYLSVDVTFLRGFCSDRNNSLLPPLMETKIMVHQRLRVTRSGFFVNDPEDLETWSDFDEHRFSSPRVVEISNL